MVGPSVSRSAVLEIQCGHLLPDVGKTIELKNSKLAEVRKTGIRKRNHELTRGAFNFRCIDQCGQQDGSHRVHFHGREVGIAALLSYALIRHLLTEQRAKPAGKRSEPRRKAINLLCRGLARRLTIT